MSDPYKQDLDFLFEQLLVKPPKAEGQQYAEHPQKTWGRAQLCLDEWPELEEPLSIKVWVLNQGSILTNDALELGQIYTGWFNGLSLGRLKHTKKYSQELIQLIQRRLKICQEWDVSHEKTDDAHLVAKAYEDEALKLGFALNYLYLLQQPPNDEKHERSESTQLTWTRIKDFLDRIPERNNHQNLDIWLLEQGLDLCNEQLMPAELKAYLDSICSDIGDEQLIDFLKKRLKCFEGRVSNKKTKQESRSLAESYDVEALKLNLALGYLRLERSLTQENISFTQRNDWRDESVTALLEVIQKHNNDPNYVELINILINPCLKKASQYFVLDLEELKQKQDEQNEEKENKGRQDREEELFKLLILAARDSYGSLPAKAAERRVCRLAKKANYDLLRLSWVTSHIRNHLKRKLEKPLEEGRSKEKGVNLDIEKLEHDYIIHLRSYPQILRMRLYDERLANGNNPYSQSIQELYLTKYIYGVSQIDNKIKDVFEGKKKFSQVSDIGIGKDGESFSRIDSAEAELINQERKAYLSNAEIETWEALVGWTIEDFQAVLKTYKNRIQHDPGDYLKNQRLPGSSSPEANYHSYLNCCFIHHNDTENLETTANFIRRIKVEDSKSENKIRNLSQREIFRSTLNLLLGEEKLHYLVQHQKLELFLYQEASEELATRVQSHKKISLGKTHAQAHQKYIELLVALLGCSTENQPEIPNYQTIREELGIETEQPFVNYRKKCIDYIEELMLIHLAHQLELEGPSWPKILAQAWEQWGNDFRTRVSARKNRPKCAED